MTKEVVLTIDGKKYDFIGIKRRSLHAPTIVIDIERLSHCTSSGIESVDTSELRLIKINGKHHLVSGFNKLVNSRDLLVNDPENKTLSARLMSSKYLDSCLVNAVSKPVVKNNIPNMKKPIVVKEDVLNSTILTITKIVTGILNELNITGIVFQCTNRKTDNNIRVLIHHAERSAGNLNSVIGDFINRVNNELLVVFTIDFAAIIDTVKSRISISINDGLATNHDLPDLQSEYPTLVSLTNHPYSKSNVGKVSELVDCSSIEQSTVEEKRFIESHKEVSAVKVSIVPSVVDIQSKLKQAGFKVSIKKQ